MKSLQKKNQRTLEYVPDKEESKELINKIDMKSQTLAQENDGYTIPKEYEEMDIDGKIAIQLSLWIRRMEKFGELRDFLNSKYGFHTFDCEDIHKLFREALQDQKEELISIAENVEFDEKDVQYDSDEEGTWLNGCEHGKQKVCSALLQMKDAK